MWRLRPAERVGRIGRKNRHIWHFSCNRHGQHPITGSCDRSVSWGEVAERRACAPLRQIALTMAVSLGCAGGLSAQDRVAWASSWAEAQWLARGQQRLVLIHFWSQSCPPCLKLERTVFTRPEVVRALHMNYVPLKVNATEDADTARAYSVQRWPTDVVVTPDGVEVHRGPCPLEPDHYIAMLDQVAVHARCRAAGDGHRQHAGCAAVRYQSVESRFGLFGWQSAGVRRECRAFIARAGRGSQSGGEIPTPPPGGSSSGASRRRGGGHLWWARSNCRCSPRPGDAAAPSSLMPDATRMRRRPTFRRWPGRPARVPPARSHPRDSTRRQVTPVRQPWTGICPVSLAEREKWVKGDVRWGVHHRGRTYLFAGPEEQHGSWRPAASSLRHCRASTGKVRRRRWRVDGKRGHGVFYRDQVFLFADEDSLRRFWESPQRYVPVIEAEQIRSTAQQTNPPR